ncbi:SRPBCC family protein [Mucilaginibacter pedocola]|uniref:Activator of Hsp90 ATPase homologue 1/2-like C-terminal domain-containing protein n=1 Tax=Mucilaginibacter pedocola TaxID=1792845 RepID=A0A1S9PIV9_9SPHI|nr:SRPBCC domain-containing protein [Mucilaginibacter pedocola]OOQ60886.1 hypothetical protein BC343_23270 [Mucilaginibacter pedocola]
MKDYEKSITVSNSSEEVYAAITQHIPDWWGDDFEGASAEVGDTYNIAFGNTKKTFEIIEAVPNKKVTWLCLKAYIDMDGLETKDEWVGTRIIWMISSNAESTQLTMLHQGLNKSVECYNICEPAWDYFMASIEAYLTIGTGTPYKKKVAKLEWEG